MLFYGIRRMLICRSMRSIGVDFEFSRANRSPARTSEDLLLRKKISIMMRYSTTHSMSVDSKDDEPGKGNDDYQLICPVSEEHFEPVGKHLANHFCREEPTMKMFGFEENPLTDAVAIELFRSVLEECLSVMIIHIPTNEVAAVSVNGIAKPEDLENEKILPVENEKLRANFRLFQNIHRCLNLFEKYGVSQMFDIKAISVSPNHRNRGLATRVIEKSLEIAQECGCAVVKTEGTSAYTQKAFTKFGFETVWERNYTAFICEDGQPVFEPSEPHCSLKVMTKLLKDNK